MGIFQEVRQQVGVPQAAAYYGLPVHRGGMAVCPFHQDQKPSLKLYEDHFYCFGCQAHGDVIDLTARLFGLGNYEAAKKLKEDFAVSQGAIKRIPFTEYSTPERECQRVVNQYVRLLRAWEKEYAPQPGQEIPERFVEAMQMLPRMEALSDLLTYGPPEDRARAGRRLKDDASYLWLKQRLEKYKEYTAVF